MHKDRVRMIEQLQDALAMIGVVVVVGVWKVVIYGIKLMRRRRD